MDSAETPLPSRRTLLRGSAIATLTTATFLVLPPSQPAQAAAPDKPTPEQEPHPSYAPIIGLL
ncbi:twin-arginine translocation signal domain-containing protein [Streptomyces canus]|uniref:twin-arginine translocation signal domain-containing protein n=1 Tax=Streptomyces canus TaxID=58343 RepID=UPI0033C66752